MKARMILALLLTLSICLNSARSNPTAAQGLPVIYFHGLNTSCLVDETSDSYKAIKFGSPYKNPVYCVEYGFEVNSLLKSISYLSQRACKELERNEAKFNLRGGFILFGSSQGNMISRYIIEACSVG